MPGVALSFILGVKTLESDSPSQPEGGPSPTAWTVATVAPVDMAIDWASLSTTTATGPAEPIDPLGDVEEDDVPSQIPDGDDDEEDDLPSRRTRRADDDEDESDDGDEEVSDPYPVTGREFATHVADLVDILERPLTEHELRFAQRWWQHAAYHFLSVIDVAAHIGAMQQRPTPDFDRAVATEIEIDIEEGRQANHNAAEVFRSVLSSLSAVSSPPRVAQAVSDFRARSGRWLGAAETRELAARVTSLDFVNTLNHLDLSNMDGLRDFFQAWNDSPFFAPPQPQAAQPAPQPAPQPVRPALQPQPQPATTGPISAPIVAQRLWESVRRSARDGSLTHVAEIVRYERAAGRRLTTSEAAEIVELRRSLSHSARDGQIASLFRRVVEHVRFADAASLVGEIGHFCNLVGRPFLLHVERGRLILEAEAHNREELFPAIRTIEARLTESSDPSADWDRRLGDFDSMVSRAGVARLGTVPVEPASQQPSVPRPPAYSMSNPPPPKAARPLDGRPSWAVDPRPWITPRTTKKLLWRAAMKIHAELERGPMNPVGVENGTVMRQFDAAIKQFGDLHKALLKARRLRKPWIARQKAVREILSPVMSIQERGARLVEQYSQITTNAATLKDVYTDLVGIWKAWGNIRVNFNDKTIETTIGPCILQHPTKPEIIKNFGHFTILFEWATLSHVNRVADSSAFRLVAEHPYRAHESRDVTHPHVNDEGLCPGTARESIALAVRQGRLFDCFEMVAQVLLNYGHSNPYKHLDEWDPRTAPPRQPQPANSRAYCRNCSSYTYQRDMVVCDCCNEGNICRGCTAECRSCGRNTCRTCAATCAVCEGRQCQACTESVEDTPFHRDGIADIVLVCRNCTCHCPRGNHVVPSDRFNDDLGVCEACEAAEREASEHAPEPAVNQDGGPESTTDGAANVDAETLRELDELATTVGVEPA